MAKERIGQTDTGKVIYSEFDPSDTRGWEFLDHAQAGCAHMIARDMARAQASQTAGAEAQRLLELAAHHFKQAELHQAECDRLEAAEQVVWH